jgi:YD repeat-containing protein
MRGHVRQLRETVYDIAGDSPVVSAHTVVDYNRAGNISRTDIFKGPDSIHVSRLEYFYDPSGERMERAVDRNPLKHTFSTILYRYDDKGRLIDESDPINGGRYDYAYDRYGYLKTRIDTTNLESPQKTKYRYDRLGRLRVEKNVRGGGSTKRYAWHGDGEIIAEIRTGKTEIDRYDERGDLVTMTATVVEKRNRRGRITRTYPVTLTAGYEYDPVGNWIRRVQLFRGEVQNVAVREIDYWDE